MLLHIFFLMAVYFIEQYIRTLRLKVSTWAKIGKVEVCYRNCTQKAAELQEETGMRSWSAIRTFPLCLSAHQFLHRNYRSLFTHPLEMREWPTHSSFIKISSIQEIRVC